MATAVVGQNELAFKDMWEEAQRNFEKSTDRKLKQVKSKTIDEVLKDIDTKLSAKDDDEDGRKKQRLKERAGNVLTFINLLGGIAAQGASMVFGPANLCFNAVHFLIEIPSKIGKFYNDLATMFEEVSEFMKQFKIYQRVEQFAEVDMELKASTHKLMIKFVEICALCIEVLDGGKLKKFKTLTKLALFDNDSGVKAKLQEFETLIDYQTRISDAVTLEHVFSSERELTDSMKAVREKLESASLESGKQFAKMQEIQDDVKATHDDVKNVKAVTDLLGAEANKRTLDSVFNEKVEAISKQLAISREDALQPQKDFDQIRGTVLEGTGSWLHDIDDYNDWRNVELDKDHLLLLSGGSGTGRSSIVSVVGDELKMTYKAINGSSTRVSVAYYAFKKNEKATRDSTGADPHRSTTALKSMAVQIAKQNVNYAKDLSSHLEHKDKGFSIGLSPGELCKDLFLPPTTKESKDVAYILLFDDLDRQSEDEAAQLFAAIMHLKVPSIRIAVTATKDLFSRLLNPFEKSLDATLNIGVEDYNEIDITKFLESELKKYKALQGSEAGLVRVVERIRKELPGVAQGSFTSVAQVLQRVNKAVEVEQAEEDEIYELINKDSLKGQEEAAADLIAELNQSLNEQEIDQVNEMVMWTIFAYEYMSIDEMRAALFLRTNKAPLQPLEKKLKVKYARLFKLSTDGEDVIYFKNDDVDDFFRSSKRENWQASSDAGEEPRISMTITINNAKVSKVQRFLWDLSEKVVFDKFDFQSALKDTSTKATISSNYVSSHLDIARRCFTLIFDDTTKDTEVLVRYAMEWLPSHLRALREPADEGTLTLSERKEIGSSLVDLLMDPKSIESHFTIDYLRARYWLNEANELTAIWTWLNDADAMAGLNRTNTNWVKGVISGAKISSLKHLNNTIARHWLSRRDWRADVLYLWINDVIDLEPEVTQEATTQENEKVDEGESKVTGTDNSEKELTTSMRIARAAGWAEKELKITEKTAMWFERLGETYLYITESAATKDILAAAKEAYLKAKELPDCHWKTSEGLAKVYAADEDKDAAITEIDVVCKHLSEKTNLTADEKSSLIQALLASAKWNVELDNADDAIDKLKQAISIDEHNYDSYVELLRLYVDQKQHATAIELLNEMRGKSAKDSEPSHLHQLEDMFLELASRADPPKYFETIFRATKHDDMFTIIMAAMDTSIEYARANKLTAKTIGLLFCQGMGLARHSPEEGRLELAFKLWNECCNLGFVTSSTNGYSSIYLAARHIINYHISRTIAQNGSAGSLEQSVPEVKHLIKRASTFPNMADAFRSSLGSLYSLGQQTDQAQQLLLNDMKTALDLLSDDDPENDYLGFKMIANVLIHAGDDLNALSAWSLLGPNDLDHKDEAHKEGDNEAAAPQEQDHTAPDKAETKVAEKIREGDLMYVCDGRCRTRWTYSNDFFCCKICYDIQFDKACLDKLKDGTLSRFICSPDHQWLHVPPWSDQEYDEVGKGNVRVEGELLDGKRVGGRIVPVEEWLDILRKIWGIEKATEKPTSDSSE